MARSPWPARKYQHRGRWSKLPPTSGHVADLGRADFDGRLPERGISLADFLAADDVGQPGVGADGQAPSLGIARDARDRLDVFQINYAIRRGYVVFHATDQVGAARKCGGTGCAQELDRVFERCWVQRTQKLSSIYAFPSLDAEARAFKTLRGLIGHSGTRTPMALVTALPMAAAVEIVGGSPTPITPRAFCSGGS